MNLINLFNFNYLKQNLKKSKGALAIFIGIIPIINILTLFLMSDNNHSNEIISLSNISIINFIGVFILPIVISICLFGYVFKKRSVDFVNSMPISRKSIFITNTIGGIGILVLMNLINAIFIYILSNTLPNLIIPIPMIIDYFILWTVAYVFIFTVSNIAVSVSGNMITSIAVSALILFLIPYIHFFTCQALIPTHNNQYILECTSKECISNEYDSIYPEYVELSKENKYMMTFGQKEYKVSYSIPANLILNVSNYSHSNGSEKLYNTTSIIKTFILSLIYIVIGYFLFINRKMEVSETSFKNTTVHNIVKCLTMVPILSFTYLIFKESYLDIISILILLVIIIAYYFIFDLITRRGINNFKLNIITLIIYIPLFMLFMKGLDAITNVKTFNVNDIDSVNIDILSEDTINPIVSEVYIEDKNFINYLLKNSAYDSYEIKNNDIPYINVNFKINNKLLYTQISFQKEEYEYIKNYLSNNDELKKTINKFEYKETYAIKIGNLVVNEEEVKELSSLCDKYIQDEVIISNLSGLRMNLYSYTNHELNNYEINTNNKEIIQKIMEIENNYLEDNLDLLNGYGIDINGIINDEYYDILDVNTKDLIDYVKKDIVNKINSNYNYGYININDYLNGKSYRYYTNDVEGLKELLEKYRVEEEYYYD